MYLFVLLHSLFQNLDDGGGGGGGRRGEVQCADESLEGGRGSLNVREKANC